MIRLYRIWKIPKWSTEIYKKRILDYCVYVRMQRNFVYNWASEWLVPTQIQECKVMELNCVQPVKAIESSISSCAPVAYIIGFLYATPTKLYKVVLLRRQRSAGPCDMLFIFIFLPSLFISSVYSYKYSTYLAINRQWKRDRSLLCGIFGYSIFGLWIP